MRKKLLVPLMLIMFVAACAYQTFTRDTYRNLVISYQTYDATLSSLGDLYKEGKLTESQKEAAIKYGNAYKIAHNGVVESLAKYEEMGGDSNSKNAIIAGGKEMAKTLASLINYAKQFIGGGD